MRSVCLTAIPRLKVSTNPDNPDLVQELIPQALDVLNYVEKALQDYNDAEYVQAHGNNPGHIDQYGR